MLVALSHTVRAGASHLCRFLLAFVLSNHLLAPAGITGEGEAGEHRLFRQNSHGHQGIHHADKTGGVAAGIGHPFGGFNARALTGQQFGKAVHPALRRTVGGRGIDDPGVGIDDQGHRFHRARQVQHSWLS